MLERIELFSKWMRKWFCKEGFIQGPSGINSFFHLTFAQSDFSGPICYCLGATKVGYKSRRSSVLSLLSFGGPAAIITRVTSVIINAFKRVTFGRASAHICKKFGKVFFPIFTNFYASSAVVRITSRIRVMASNLHGSPNPKFRGLSSSVFEVHNGTVTLNLLKKEI